MAKSVTPPGEDARVMDSFRFSATCRALALAARELGLGSVPLLCCREIPVPGSMPRVIRVLLHFYAPEGHVPAHAYIGEAQKLRADLGAAQ